jgi:hypothetical protein
VNVFLYEMRRRRKRGGSVWIPGGNEELQKLKEEKRAIGTS